MSDVEDTVWLRGESGTDLKRQKNIYNKSRSRGRGQSNVARGVMTIKVNLTGD